MLLKQFFMPQIDRNKAMLNDIYYSLASLIAEETKIYEIKCVQYYSVLSDCKRILIYNHIFPGVLLLN